jgi:hypothetical protein
MMRWYDPRIVLAFTVPVVFLGILVGKSIQPNSAIDATIAGGLVAILGAIVNGILNQDKGKDEDECNDDE